MDEHQIVTFAYTNWRGEETRRRCLPQPGTLRFATVSWHPEPQWVFDAWDLDRQTLRTFGLTGIREWQAAALPPSPG